MMANMVQRQSIISVPVVWKGKKFVLEINPEASLKELGEKLLTLTEVKADTIRLIIPQPSTKSSRLLMPFSDGHSSIRLQDAGILEGKPLRMMGVSKDEIDHVTKDSEANLRIAGFEEEERRMRQRMSRGSHASLKLPQGTYIFCAFRTLELPGIELNPSPSEALKRMHMLAADPGIVAIMNKHRWRVGIMTEMAPVGYVGISPKCLLGLNKNRGEEISLRLRTDDLKGFRKYESIKKTLLHELLNQEAFALDWTKSRSHTLADSQFSGHDDLDMDFDLDISLPHKLGGETSLMSAGARVASVAAAYHRLAESSIISQEYSADEVQHSNNYTSDAHGISSPVDPLNKKELFACQRTEFSNHAQLEPDPETTTMNVESAKSMEMPNATITEMGAVAPHFSSSRSFDGVNVLEEPVPDDFEVSEKGLQGPTVDCLSMQIENNEIRIASTINEPDPDDSEARHILGNVSREDQSQLSKVRMELDSDDCQQYDTEQIQPDPDNKAKHLPQISEVISDEPDPDDDIRRIQDPVALFLNRLNRFIELLCTQLDHLEAMVVLQTLFKIIKNVSENPNVMKYKKLRKANPAFQRSVANHEAAMEVLFLIGFSEEVATDELGKAESYLVLKRNDPGLLWLAKSSLEASIAK
ncbi:hypothetical protein RDABS01_022205 [Bienertia sinuspersici]